jgi:hypothetical protein
LPDSRFFLFPWREEEIVPGRSKRLRRPTVDISLQFNDQETSQRALIDTGAPRTVFPLGVAVALGLTVPQEPYDGVDLKRLQFLGDEWVCFCCRLTLSLPPYPDLRWEAEVDFVLSEGLPFGLLGCEGFLDHWAVSFNAYHTYMVIEPVESLHRRVPIDVFEMWQREWPDYN